jgi:hypothetical protein
MRGSVLTDEARGHPQPDVLFVNLLPALYERFLDVTDNKQKVRASKRDAARLP